MLGQFFVVHTSSLRWEAFFHDDNSDGNGNVMKAMSLLLDLNRFVGSRVWQSNLNEVSLMRFAK